ncbi:MAG: alanine:cation symporter family protein, partial [Clostridia bacterium]|nr:alanine:cation symporter family protein [Clostridia bacterium]
MSGAGGEICGGQSGSAVPDPDGQWLDGRRHVLHAGRHRRTLGIRIRGILCAAVLSQFPHHRKSRSVQCGLRCFEGDSRLICGIVLAVLTGSAILFGTHRIEKITSALIPVLTGGYLAITLGIIFSHASLLPGIFRDIISSAFTGRAVLGASAGFTVHQALRFGIMRGIFSNEAGCGTSPTAHAAADTKSPHYQAVLGMVEVIFDTLILCTLTALVLLIGDAEWGLIPWGTDADAAPVTLDIFRCLGGDTVYRILRISVLLFAFSTVIAQFYYGTAAIRYLSGKRLPQVIYAALSAVCACAGSVISSPV